MSFSIIKANGMIISQAKLVLVLLIVGISGCKKTEIQPIGSDLGKEVAGSYNVKSVFIVDPVNGQLIASYYLADSMQTGQLQIKRIDRSKVSITIGVNKQNGDTVYTNSLTADVSDSDKSMRLLTMKGSNYDAGTYDVNGQFLSIDCYSTYKGKSNILFSFIAFR